MTCVGYEEDFVRLLARYADQYTPPPPKSSKKRKHQEEGRRPQQKSAGTGSEKHQPDEVNLLSDVKSEHGINELPAFIENHATGQDVITNSTSRRSTRTRIKRVRTS